VIAPYKNGDGTPKDWSQTDSGNFRDTHPSNLWTDISIPFWSIIITACVVALFIGD
jgi:site-specific DNA-methyltransferase (adenine-specific)